MIRTGPGCNLGESRMITEERLVDIEIKIARQEDLVETLNKTVYQQQKKLMNSKRFVPHLPGASRMCPVSIAILVQRMNGRRIISRRSAALHGAWNR